MIAPCTCASCLSLRCKLTHCWQVGFSTFDFMDSQWAACPPNILQRCFRAQLDYNDNAAAACACTLWRDSFQSEAKLVSDLSLVYSPQRSQPGRLYLRRFAAVRSADLVGFPTWDRKVPDPNVYSLSFGQHQSTPIQEWTDTLQMLPTTCCSLTLDRYLPCLSGNHSSDVNRMTQSLSQLSNLQHLTIQVESGATFVTEPLSVLASLQVLQVSSRHAGCSVHLMGSLQSLPPSITRLQLSYFDKHEYCQPELALDLGNLMHLKLRDLDLYSSGWRRLDYAAASGRLSQLTRLGLSRSMGFDDSYDDILALTSLRILHLRDCQNVAAEVEYPELTDLLSALPCLQELDVLNGGRMSAAASRQLTQLSSFSCYFYAALDLDLDLDMSCFQHFGQDEPPSGALRQPFFRMDYAGSAPDLPPPECGIQGEIEQLPFNAVTLLTMFSCRTELLLRLNQMHLPHLRMLYILFPPEHKFSPTSDTTAFHLNPQWRLTELYLSDSPFSSYDFSQCTSLVSISVLHNSPGEPVLVLPPCVTQLSLHNTFSANIQPGLDQLNDLVSIRLGGKPTDTDVGAQLPILPQSLTELDLWDGLFTGLQQLSRLTNLKKLFMPEAPTPQQLQCIKLLRQLRHLEVSGGRGFWGLKSAALPWM